MDKKILIIEDDETQRELMVQMISHLGYQVKSAGTGKEGLDLLTAEEFDLTMIDIHLPDTSGFQVMNDIQTGSAPASKNTIILLMSVDTSDESAILGISSGADGYIGKPIRLNELAQKLGSLMKIEVTGEQIKEISEEIRKVENSSSTWSRDLLNYMLEDGAGRKNDYLVTFASVLTIRVNGLDEMTDTLESDAFHKELRTLIDDLSRIVYKNRGSMNHIVNETIMSTFGTPVVYDLDTLNALICAGELLEFFQTYRERVKATYKIEPKITIGITSGKIYSGSISGVRRLNHAVLGQPVRRAQLLISLDHQEGNRLLIDQETKKVIEDYAELVEFDPSNTSFKKDDLFELKSIDYEKVYALPNFKKQYTPKDSISDEGYEKL
ncbi:MAG: response regulator [Leptospirales bacterium]